MSERQQVLCVYIGNAEFRVDVNVEKSAVGGGQKTAMPEKLAGYYRYRHRHAT